MVWLLNKIIYIRNDMTLIHAVSQIVHSVPNYANVTKSSSPKVPFEFSLDSCVSHALLLLAERGFTAFLLIDLRVSKSENFCRGGQRIDSGQNLYCYAKYVGLPSKLKIVTTELYHTSNVTIPNDFIVWSPPFEIKMHNVRRISENEIYSLFDISAALLEAIWKCLK